MSPIKINFVIFSPRIRRVWKTRCDNLPFGNLAKHYLRKLRYIMSIKQLWLNDVERVQCATLNQLCTLRLWERIIWSTGRGQRDEDESGGKNKLNRLLAASKKIIKCPWDLHFRKTPIIVIFLVLSRKLIGVRWAQGKSAPMLFYNVFADRILSLLRKQRSQHAVRCTCASGSPQLFVETLGTLSNVNNWLRACKNLTILEAALQFR